MSKPHWFPFYVADFLSSPTVTMMTAEEVGGYLLLLCYAWQDPQGSLQPDDDSLRVLSRVKGDLSRIKSCFTEKKGRLYNKRLTQELEKAKEKSASARRSNAMRWQSERKANAKRTHSSSQSESQSQSESERRDKKEDKTLAPWRERLEVFWNSYPKKKGKGNVEAWFKKHNPSQEIIERMVKTIQALLHTDDWQKDRGQYIPYPATWLNAKGWEDEVGTSGLDNGHVTQAKIPPFPGPEDPIGRNLWRQAYGNPR
jgi:uncharacterized protein YdaU (DUF1376 family)